MDSLVHEIGHNLGLWHVHHGVSEVECGDPCTETTASMELGDLCADTNPTPQNVQCEEPGVGADSCGLMSAYRGTPFRNYMSYAGDDMRTQVWFPCRRPKPFRPRSLTALLSLLTSSTTTSNMTAPVAAMIMKKIVKIFL